MGIQINGNTDTISAIDGGLTVSGASLGSASASSLNISGIVTASSFSGPLTGNVTGNVNSTGVSTFSGGLLVGTGASISSPETNVLTLGTNNTESVRINSSGHFIMPAGSFDLMVGDSTNSNAGTQTISVGSTASGSSGGIQLWANPTNGNSWIQFGDNSASASQYRGWVNYQHADDNLNFGTAGTEKLRIDSSGRVTMPYQPGFKISVGNRTATGSGRILSTDAGDTFSSNRDCFNTGNHFTTSNGRFTAPVAGRYMFIFSFMRNVANGSDINVKFQKNTASGESQTMYGRIYAGAYTSNYQQSIGVTITQLSVNDYVNLFIAGNTSIYDDDTFFAGHLLG